MKNSQKIVALEALRGIAALVVLFSHVVLAFYPQFTAAYAGKRSTFQVYDGPWYALLNGRAAVIVFFVLSGYVLTQKYFSTGERAVILISAIKRWPRLIPLPLISVLISAALLSLLPFYFIEAAQMSGSKWMTVAIFGGQQGKLEPGLLDAFMQGTVFTFFRGDNYYNTSLWTMWWEFAGSFIVFAFALALNWERLPIVGRLIVAFIALTATFYWTANIGAFVAGACLSYIVAKSNIRTGFRLGLVLSAIAIIMLSYHAGGWLDILRRNGMDPYRFHFFVVPALTLVYVLSTCESIRAPLSGRAFAWLGDISFALYVLHVPVIGSIGAIVYLSWGPLPAAIASVVASLGGATLLSRIDQKWLSGLNALQNGIRQRLRALRRSTVATG